MYVCVQRERERERERERAGEEERERGERERETAKWVHNDTTAQRRRICGGDTEALQPRHIARRCNHICGDDRRCNHRRGAACGSLAGSDSRTAARPPVQRRRQQADASERAPRLCWMTTRAQSTYTPTPSFNYSFIQCECVYSHCINPNCINM